MPICCHSVANPRFRSAFPIRVADPRCVVSVGVMVIIMADVFLLIEEIDLVRSDCSIRARVGLYKYIRMCWLFVLDTFGIKRVVFAIIQLPFGRAQVVDNQVGEFDCWCLGVCSEKRLLLLLLFVL